LIVGLIQVIEYEPVRLFTVKVTGGGAGNTFNVTVALQPKGSNTVTVVIPIGRPVAVSEFPDKEPGTGLQVMTGFTEADPAVVNEAAEIVFVQPACCTEPNAIGAGVTLTVITFVIGAHDPGGFIERRTVPL
jgi:hypothetical protein